MEKYSNIYRLIRMCLCYVPPNHRVSTLLGNPRMQREIKPPVRTLLANQVEVDNEKQSNNLSPSPNGP